MLPGLAIGKPSVRLLAGTVADGTDTVISLTMMNKYDSHDI